MKYCRQWLIQVNSLVISSYVGNAVLSEVHRVMDPSKSRAGHSSPSQSISTLVRSSQISRKSDGKSKVKAAAEKYQRRKKPKLSTGSFQKKVIVFDYMGSRSPSTFTRAEKFVFSRGLLPSLPLVSSEAEIRSEICELIASSGSVDEEFGPNDFEFINMSGKQATVPRCKEGFEWDGRSVKELAGAGSLYVRLTKSLSYQISSSSEQEDPPPPECL